MKSKHRFTLPLIFQDYLMLKDLIFSLFVSVKCQFHHPLSPTKDDADIFGLVKLFDKRIGTRMFSWIEGEKKVNLNSTLIGILNQS